MQTELVKKFFFIVIIIIIHIIIIHIIIIIIAIYLLRNTKTKWGRESKHTEQDTMGSTIT